MEEKVVACASKLPDKFLYSEEKKWPVLQNNDLCFKVSRNELACTKTAIVALIQFLFYLCYFKNKPLLDRKSGLLFKE